MKKIKYFTLIAILLLILTGCGKKEGKNIIEASQNTSITDKGLESYRAKVSISGKNIDENYTVLNKNNKTYNITLMKNGEQIFIDIKNGKTTVTTENEKEYKKEIKYDYSNTDMFLDLLYINDDVETKKIDISGQEYTEYDFKVTSEAFNKIMKNFDIKVSKDGTGFAYVDKDNHVFLVNYIVDGITVNVTYTRLNGIK